MQVERVVLNALVMVLRKLSGLMFAPSAIVRASSSEKPIHPEKLFYSEPTCQGEPHPSALQPFRMALGQLAISGPGLRMFVGEPQKHKADNRH